MAKSKMAKRNKLSKKRNNKKRNTKKRNTKKRNTKKRNNVMRGGLPPFSCGSIGKQTNELHDGDESEASKIAKAWLNIGNSFCAAKSHSGSNDGNYYLYDGNLLDSRTKKVAKARQQKHLHIFKDPYDENKTCAIPKHGWDYDNDDVSEKVQLQDSTIINNLHEGNRGSYSC